MIKITVVQTTTASTDDGLDPERVSGTDLNKSADFSLEGEDNDDTSVTSCLSSENEPAGEFCMCVPCEIEV